MEVNAETPLSLTHKQKPKGKMGKCDSKKFLHIKNLINKINKQVINWGIQYIADEGLILLQINRKRHQQKWAPSLTDM